MIEYITLANVVDREAPAPIQVRLTVVGQVAYIDICEYHEDHREAHYKTIERPLTEEEQKERKPSMLKTVMARCAVDLGDLVEAVTLLRESSARLQARTTVEAEQAAKRKRSVEVELAEQTADAANKRFTKLYEEHELLKGEAEVLREEIEKAQTELRGAKWKLAEELHRQGRGPEPVEEEAADA